MPRKGKKKGGRQTFNIKVANQSAKKTTNKTKRNPLFQSTPKKFGLGQNVQPKRDLGRYVRWPQYVRLQRQRAVLLQRLKVPPQINQFRNTLDKGAATKLFGLLNKYRPETRQAKKQRLQEAAEAKVDGKSASSTKPIFVKYGLNHVTHLVEQKKAKLVVIAHDVDPLELVVWLPCLCQKMGVPYVIVKGKSRLGTVVHKKTAAALALVDVRKEDQSELSQLITVAKNEFNDRYDDLKRRWGGQQMGFKHNMIKLKREKLLEREARRV